MEAVGLQAEQQRKEKHMCTCALPLSQIDPGSHIKKKMPYHFSNYSTPAYFDIHNLGLSEVLNSI